MSRAIVAERQTGEREVLGTTWPIVDRVERVELASKRPRWVVTRGLCNGVPVAAREHSTKVAALADYDSEVAS